MRPRKCNCNKKGCIYCHNRNHYEHSYDKINLRSRIVTELKQKHREEIMIMPIDELIESVQDE